MGDSAYINLAVQDASLTEIYLKLLERMLTKADVTEATMFGSSRKENSKLWEILDPQPTSATGIWSVRLEPLLNPSDVVQVIEHLNNTFWHVSLTLSYPLASGWSVVPIDLNLFGNRYIRSGVWPPDQICLCLPLSCIRSHREQRPVTEQIADLEESFFRACGLAEDTQPDPNLLHAALKYDACWVSPADCAMIYHRDIQDFRRDFHHIYVDYALGIRMGYLILSAQEFWNSQLNASSQTFPKINRSPPPREYLEQHRLIFDSAEKIQFLEQLDLRLAQQISSLPIDVISQILPQILSQASDVTFSDLERGSYEIPIRWHDKGGNGFILSTDPLAMLWPAYKNIMDSVRTSLL